MRTGFLNYVTVLLATVLLAACASPHLSAEMEVGKMAFQTGDYPKAFHQLLPIAKAGRPEAQYAVGYMYYYGYGVPRDLSAGMFWIGRAAAQHYPAADQALERIRQDNAAHESSEVTARLYPKKSLHVKKSPAMSLPQVVKKQPRHTDVAKVARVMAPEKKHEQVSGQKTGENTCAGEAARYVLQLYGSWEFSRVSAVRKQLGLRDQGAICVTKRDGGKWYVLVTGQYANMDAAKKAKAELPSRLKAAHPWIRGTQGLFAAEL